MIDNDALNWLNNNMLSYNIWNKKYRYKEESFEDWLNRISNNNEPLKKLIKDKKFIFGGRTLANRQTGKGSYSNCYSIGFVPDSLDGIMNVAKDIAMTFKSQGGQGLSLSKIRPKGALIHNQFPSDGIVPFMEIFNTTTESISQGGSRKGALLMSLDINHPEAETFMTIKSDLKKINKANLSMEIDDDFMNSLDSNAENLRKFKLLSEQAYKYAEPGVIFTNRFRNYNLMQYVDDYQIETCNPCGEQPLPKHGACNLSSINISEYVLDAFSDKACIDWTTLKNDLVTIVFAMNEVLLENLNNHALKEQTEMANKYRNIGIGIMGLHDALIKLGLVYGSNDAVMLTEYIMKTIFKYSIRASMSYAEQYGNFPGYDPKVWDADILKEVFTDKELEFYKERGKLGNCSLLSIAPTGSIGTMWNVSTGIEPWFNTHYIRNTKSLDGKETSYKVWAPIIEQAIKIGWHPETCICANDISWKAHIDMQSACQKYVDTSISKTINLAKAKTSIEEIEELYKYAWKKGLKGCTIYVEGSRDPILSTDSNSKAETLENSNEVSLNSIDPITRDTFGESLSGQTFRRKTACGTLYVTINKDDKGNIVEIFTNTSKNGTCKANLNGETRMASLALRAGVKVEEVIDQLKGIYCQSCAFAKAKGNQIDGTSCPDIIAKTIQKCYNNKVETSKLNTNKDICPECGATLTHEGGCVSCRCGYSKCN